MTPSPAIEITGLVKDYGKDVRALDGVDLTVPEGSIFGFLGPNGAGKTTTLKILTGLASPTSGTARVLGYEAGDRRARQLTGFLPDVPGFYPWMSATEFLRFSGGLFGLEGRALRSRVSALLDLAGLSGVKTRVGGYSRGMRQRLGIAQALVNAPRVLLLDEPTSALDPLGRKEVLEMIASLAGRTTVFFSTHILADAERVCDSVAILDRGRVIAQSGMAELKARFGSARLVLEVADGTERLAEALRASAFVSGIAREGEDTLILTVSDLPAAEREIPALIASLGLRLHRFEAGEASLEEAFVDLVGGDRDFAGAGSRR